MPATSIPARAKQPASARGRATMDENDGGGPRGSRRLARPSGQGTRGAARTCSAPRPRSADRGLWPYPCVSVGGGSVQFHREFSRRERSETSLETHLTDGMFITTCDGRTRWETAMAERKHTGGKARRRPKSVKGIKTAGTIEKLTNDTQEFIVSAEAGGTFQDLTKGRERAYRLFVSSPQGIESSWQKVLDLLGGNRFWGPQSKAKNWTPMSCCTEVCREQH